MFCSIANDQSPFPTLVIASHNAGKVVEIGELVAPLGMKVLSATEANIDEPEETGDTFEANAALKSEHAAAACGLPSLADDSGLVVPAIGGAPGIYSARWAGPNKDFAAAFKRIEEELLKASHAREDGHPVQSTSWIPAYAGMTDEKAGMTDAYFVCVLALTIPGQNTNGATHLFRGEIHGKLTFPPRGNRGFGYDPIFIPNGYDQTFGECDPAFKNQISHRAQAFKKFLAFIPSLFQDPTKPVMPVKTGIQNTNKKLDSRLRGNDKELGGNDKKDTL